MEDSIYPHSDDDSDSSSFSIPEELAETLLEDEKYSLPVEDVGGDEFASPIFFADGMDYQECQRYYELRDAQQHQGGMVRRRVQEKFRRSSSMNDTGEIRSILKGKATRTAHKKAVRRFSLTEIPAAGVDDQEAVWSKDDATDVEPQRVGFREYVFILTHSSIP
jgi:hypothetical protein